MHKFRRRIFYIDPKVQGALMVRVFCHWIYCLFTISLMLVWWDLFAGPPRRFMVVLIDVYTRFAPAAAASLLIVPLVIMDVLRLSNRFAGPAWRLKISLKALAEGKEVRPIHFRDNDFWREMAEDFNCISGRLNQVSNHIDPSQPPAEETAEEPVALVGHRE